MLIAYKGFESDLTCRGFQYKLGETFELSDKPILCERGFHACLLPIDVVQYYPYKTSIYTKVELSECDTMKDLYDFVFDTKICGRRILVSTRKICIDELIYKTFYLLDQLAVFADLCAIPSEHYRVINRYASSIDMRIGKAIPFAHSILGSIISKLVDSHQIYNVDDFVKIVAKLQQSKEE